MINTSPLPPVRILLVDDSVAWRTTISAIAQTESSLQFVSEASNGLEAIEQALNSKPDLILLDLNLPKLNGIGACRDIREHLPESKILFISQQTDSDLVQAAFEAGALGYVHKARVQKDLLKAIHTVLENRLFFSEGLNAHLYDVFSGSGADAVWMETVVGLSSASERMKVAGEKAAGKYFVFCRTTKAIVEVLETSALGSELPHPGANVAWTIV